MWPCYITHVTPTCCRTHTYTLASCRGTPGPLAGGAAHPASSSTLWATGGAAGAAGGRAGPTSASQQGLPSLPPPLPFGLPPAYDAALSARHEVVGALRGRIRGSGLDDTRRWQVCLSALLLCMRGQSIHTKYKAPSRVGWAGGGRGWLRSGSRWQQLWWSWRDGQQGWCGEERHVPCPSVTDCVWSAGRVPTPASRASTSDCLPACLVLFAPAQPCQHPPTHTLCYPLINCAASVRHSGPFPGVASCHWRHSSGETGCLCSCGSPCLNVLMKNDMHDEG